jgi:hypothetical protein
MAGGLLEPPVDQVELAERILAWWQVYVLDRLGSILSGLIGGLPFDYNGHDAIETVFPRNLIDYEMVRQ